jgi:hypothetical protein
MSYEWPIPRAHDIGVGREVAIEYEIGAAAFPRGAGKEIGLRGSFIVADNRERFPAQLQGMNDFGLQNLVKGAIEH